MKKLTKSLLASAIAASTLGLSLSVSAEDAANVSEMFTKGKASVAFRARYENVDQEGKPEKASLLSLRTRLGFNTASLMGFYGNLEMDHIAHLGDEEKHNSPTNPSTDHPTIMDPKNTHLNQAYLGYKYDKMVSAKFGRTRVVLDDQRFVGAVGWRQNEQTFDLIEAKVTPIEKLDIYAAYSNVQHFVNLTDNLNDSIFLNVGYKGLDFIKGSVFGYLIEKENKDTNDTFGLRVAGPVKIGEGHKIIYAASYASQSQENSNTKTSSLSYMLAELGYGYKGYALKAGYESQGSKDGVSFKTPYGTNHKFNGWADKFLSTPADGLVDVYVTGVAKVPNTGLKLVATYHKFDSDEGSVDYGSEIDFLAAYKFNKHYNVALKYANYSQGDDTTAQTDTQKVWLQAVAKY